MLFLILCLAVLICVATAYYLITRVCRFGWVASRKHPKLVAMLLLSPLLVCLFLSFITTVVIVLHLIVFWALCDLAAYLIKRFAKKEFKRYYQGAIAVGLCAVYLANGWFNAHNVAKTSYTILTDKEISAPLRIVLIADAHIGEVMSTERFAEEIKRIEAEAPDIVVVCGDLADEDTEKTDMQKAAAALGKLETTYGIYYVFGNHDKGFTPSRGFDEFVLREILAQNNITILEDESVLIADSYYLIGRADRSEEDRRSIRELTAELDEEKFTIVLNHQPNDYAAEAAAGVDLVLSGHTHGGHIFPVGLISLALGANDYVYGMETRKNTNFIVTSGISGWGVPLKTFAKSEYVVIDIEH